ncbi:hypothetical protein ATANTOWER_017350 [Ataeniobius toweri]|uniref:B30.2/SPRY domain-containing protein n=1 Tax=Ataeniobius toweri TaxID=208326 RepID=A0ABU7BKX3_9TELE|nr:hypothetical protein [Ataeniobius toweri]
MSHQVCHCGWSKVTTYHGLRTHQGKMGCTPKGMHIPENKLYSYLPLSFNQPSLIKINDLSTDIFRTSMKPELESWQVCHCGWSKVTTYHGLRTHQGMMGCTPKGIRIPEHDQNSWSNKWEQSHQNDNWRALTAPVKEEKVFMSPNLAIQMNSGPTQALEQDMYPPKVQTKEDYQDMVENPMTSKTLEFTFSCQTDTSSPLNIFTTQRSFSPSRIPPTESVTSIFQTPPHSQLHSGSSKKACRVLDFSSVAINASEDPDKDAVIDEKEKEREAKRLLQARQDMMKVQLQQKIHIREQKMAEVRSAEKSCKGSLDAEWLQINSVFSEVIRSVEDARLKALEPLEKRRQKVKREAQNLLQTLQGEIDRLRNSIDELERNPDLQASPPSGLDDSKGMNNLNIDTSFSFGTLRVTTSTMMKEIQAHLENLSSLELKRTATFVVDVKLDPATAHQCLVLSNDGKKVRDGGEKPKGPDAPERFNMFGSVLGINSLNRGRSYWEVEVKNKTGWDLGVARRNANRKGILELNPNNGYWVAVHFENRKYATMTVPPTNLPLKEKPEKVGVFLDYEEGVVSFYDVTQILFVHRDWLIREEKMNAVLLTVLVLVVGGNTALGIAPCQRTARNNAYNSFLRKHVLQGSFDTRRKSEWERYLTNLNLCDRPRQSFVRSTDQERFVQICNGNGKLLNDNLCTSTSRVRLYDLRLQRNSQRCTVTYLRAHYKYVTVACDKVDNLCRPVHFESSQDRKPSSSAQTCGATTDHWFQF